MLGWSTAAARSGVQYDGRTTPVTDPRLSRPSRPWAARGLHPAVHELAAALRAGAISRRTFIAAASRLGVAAPVAAAIAGVWRRAAAAEPAVPPPSPAAGGTLRCSMNVKEVSDPAIFDWSEKANVVRHMVEPLVRIDAANIARPWLAERWQASDDLKTWTFFLRRDVVWSNGDAFVAEDVAFNVRRWLDPQTGSSNLSRFAALTTSVATGKTTADGKPVTSTSLAAGAIEIIDDHTVRFHLTRPDVSLPESFADYPALIVHRRFSEEGGDLTKNPVGTGPFRLAEFVVGEKAVLVRRQDRPWWGGSPRLDRIVYLDHGDDAGAQLAALASGQVDCNFRSSIEQIDTISRIPGLKLYQTTTASCGVARMRVTEKPFDALAVRRAIQAAIDHDEAQRLVFRGYGAPGEDHHVAPLHPEYAPLPKRRRDLERARQQLSDAGYRNGIRLVIDCVASPPWEANVCKVFAEMLKPAGIELAINVLPGATYWDRWQSTPFGFTAWAHRPLGIQVLNLAYRSNAGWNETGYANPAFDALLDEASGIIDPGKRRPVMDKLQRTLQDDAIIVQSTWRPTFMAAHERVQGLVMHPAEEHHFEGVWLAAS